MKVFVAEEGREVVLEALARATVIATSRISYVECRAAFARALREGRISARSEGWAVRALDRRWGQLVVVELDDALAREAASLARRHPLRAADAIHLASADLLAGGRRREIHFACWDRRLWEVAGPLAFVRLPAVAP